MHPSAQSGTPNSQPNELLTPLGAELRVFPVQIPASKSGHLRNPYQEIAATHGSNRQHFNINCGIVFETS
jgi:hypothetical protein